MQANQIQINGREYAIINQVANGNGIIAQIRGERGAVKTACNYGNGWVIVGK